MSKLTLKKLEAAALPLAVAAAFVGVTPAHAAITGNTTTDFTARVNVVSDNTCTLTVTPPDNTVFEATWTANVASGTSGFSNLTTSAPPEVSVVAEGAATCSLNAVKIVTAVTGATERAGKSAALVNFGNSGGSWAVLPFVARARYFTDTAATTPGVATVTLHTAVAGDTEQVTSSPTGKGIAGTSGQFTTRGGPSFAKSYLMADSYVRDQLATDALGDTTTATFSKAEVYKSALFGISARIGSAPVDSTGAIDLNLAANGDVVNMPFTVTITEA